MIHVINSSNRPRSCCQPPSPLLDEGAASCGGGGGQVKVGCKGNRSDEYVSLTGVSNEANQELIVRLGNANLVLINVIRRLKIQEIKLNCRGGFSRQGLMRNSLLIGKLLDHWSSCAK